MIIYNVFLFAASIALSGLVATGFLLVFKNSPWKLPLGLLMPQPEIPPDEKVLLRERVIQICTESDDTAHWMLEREQSEAAIARPPALLVPAQFQQAAVRAFWS